MGQYRQWLHYREVDQRLHRQRERLIGELAHLQEQTRFSEPSLLDTNNVVVQALALLAEAPSADVLSPSSDAASTTKNGDGPTQNEFISSALFDHSRLSDLDSFAQHNRELPPSPASPASTYVPLPPIPHRDINLLPEDMNTIFEEHGQTDPQLTLPRWLHKAALSATQGGSLDQQGIRTNRLVQRWLERWGHHSEQTEQEGQTSHPIRSEQTAKRPEDTSS